MFLELLQKNSDFYPNGVAIKFGDAEISNAEFMRYVEDMGRGLLALGVTPGTRCALLLENSPEFVACFFAVAACRGVSVPLNPKFKEDELVYYCTDADVRFLIVDNSLTDVAGRVAARVPHDVRIIVRGPSNGNRLTISTLVSEGKRNPQSLPASRLDDQLVYLYSSGTTGRPKCAPRTVVQYWREMVSVIEALDLRRTDTVFGVIPLFHNFGAVQCMLAAPGAGARLVIFEEPHPFALRRDAVIRTIESEKVTIFPCVPFMLDLLVESSQTADLSSVRVCYSAAAMLKAETAKAFHEKFGIPVRNHYGCTEVGAIAINFGSESESDPRIVGVPFPGVRIRVVDDDGNEVPQGETGQVAVSSRAMTDGYINTDQPNDGLWKNGWFLTGDLGSIDAGKRLTIIGRKKHVIDVLGYKVSPIEVEDVLMEHSSVNDAVVVGAPDPHGDGDTVIAYVELSPACDIDELRSHCRKKLMEIKVPTEFIPVPRIPRNPMGKKIRDKVTIDTELNILPTRNLRGQAE